MMVRVILRKIGKFHRIYVIFQVLIRILTHMENASQEDDLSPMIDRPLLVSFFVVSTHLSVHAVISYKREIG